MPTNKHDIAVSVLPPMLPNFLKVEARIGDPLRLPVGALSDREASDVWDAWKVAWMDHVAKKRLSRTAE